MTAAVQRPIAYMEAIKSIVNEISQVQELQPLLEHTVGAIQYQLDFYIASIFWYDAAREEAELLAQMGKIGGPPPIGFRQSLHTGVLGRTLREQAPLLVNDVCQDPSYIAPQGYEQGGSELCVPIFKSGELWGAFNVESQNSHAFSDADCLALELVATHLGNTIAALEMRSHEQQMLLELRLQHTQLQQLYTLVLQLSTPVIPLYPGILAMPLIGTLEGERAHHMGRELLRVIQQSHSSAVILDVTGLAAIDAGVAHTLLSITQSCRLLGATIVLTGLRPEVAQTLARLQHIDGIIVRGDFAAGVNYALRLQGLEICRTRSLLRR